MKSDIKNADRIWNDLRFTPFVVQSIYSLSLHLILPVELNRRTEAFSIQFVVHNSKYYSLNV